MKKRNIIRQLLLDDPCSHERIEMGDGYWKIIDVIKEVENMLDEKIGGDEELTKLIQRYTDALDELALEEAEAYFEKGVKFGVLFGMQIAEE